MTNNYTSANLNLTYLAADQSQKHVSVNESIRRLDGLTQLSVVNSTTTHPPSQISEGACYLIPTTATSIWQAQRGNIAMYADSGWIYMTPQEGWRIWDKSTHRLRVFSSDAWHSLAERDMPASLVTIDGTHTTTRRTHERPTAPILPSNHLMIGVAAKVSRAISGTSSWSLGFDGQTRALINNILPHLNTKIMSPVTPAFFSTDKALLLKSANNGIFSNGIIKLRIFAIKLQPFA